MDHGRGRGRGYEERLAARSGQAGSVSVRSARAAVEHEHSCAHRRRTDLIRALAAIRDLDARSQPCRQFDADDGRHRRSDVWVAEPDLVTGWHVRVARSRTDVGWDLRT